MQQRSNVGKKPARKAATPSAKPGGKTPAARRKKQCAPRNAVIVSGSWRQSSFLSLRVELSRPAVVREHAIFRTFDRSLVRSFDPLLSQLANTRWLQPAAPYATSRLVTLQQ